MQFCLGVGELVGFTVGVGEGVGVLRDGVELAEWVASGTAALLAVDVGELDGTATVGAAEAAADGVGDADGEGDGEVSVGPMPLSATFTARPVTAAPTIGWTVVGRCASTTPALRLPPRESSTARAATSRTTTGP